jgi:hypothetical protein
VSQNALEVVLLRQYHTIIKHVLLSPTSLPSTLLIFIYMQGKNGVSRILAKNPYGKHINGIVVIVELSGQSDRTN